LLRDNIDLELDMNIEYSKNWHIEIINGIILNSVQFLKRAVAITLYTT